MAKTNQTYYNKQGTDFSGMFDAGQDFTPVDWSTITNDLVDKIATETKRRETKKADIQTKTDALMTDLRDYQAGANNTFNGYVLDGSTQVKDYMLMQNKLLKNGKLDPNSYVRSTQLLQDDWNSFQTAVESFNADYAAAVEKANTGDLSALGDLSFNKMQSATDIQNSRIVVSTDGRMYSQNKDGELVGFGTLNGRQKDLPMNWNVQSEVKSGFTANIGKTVKAFGRMTVESAMQSDEFKKAEATYIEGIIGSIDSPNATGRDFLSILTNHHGYSLTEDPTEAAGDTKKILVKADSNGMMQPDPKSLYTAENRKLAEETIRNAIRSQLDYIEKPGGLISVSERIHALGKQDKIDALDDVYALVAGLSSANANDSQSALDTLANQFGAIDKVKNITDAAGHNTGLSITLSTGAQPVDIMFRTPNGELKTRKQITAELFPIFHDGKLGTSQFAEIEAKYLDTLGEDATIFSNNAYQTPLINEGEESYSLNYERKKEIPRVDVTKITIGGKGASTAAGDHADAIKELLKTDADDKDDKIKALNTGFMHELESVLTFTEKDGEDFKTGSLDLEMNKDGSIVVVTPDGITHVIVNSLTGDVNLNQLQELINARQVGAGTFTSGSGQAMSKFNTGS